MTDLERARDLRRSLEAAIHPAMRDCFEKCVAHLLDAARREGAEEMREKAAHAVEVQLVSAKHGEWLWKVYFPRMIRAIQLTSEK